MATGSSVGDWFEQGRPSPRSLEIDQVLGSLSARFGVGDAPPVKLGRYRVAGRIGAGGLGLVYRAYDPSLARFVAIKVLKAAQRPTDDPAVHESRLLREAQVLARIRHPHVVEVFDVGFFDDHGATRFFVAMELVEGTDLRHWLTQAPGWAAIRKAFVAAAQGLHAAHQQGLLHRDFKPSNVLMGKEGAIKVADFGLAAVTEELRAELETGTLSGGLDGVATPSWRPGGTPHYMSPEQQRGEPLTPASDQYGFCVSLHEAVYGHRPFDAQDRASLLAAKEAGPNLVGGNRALRQLLTRGLQPEPTDRFPDMDAVHRALEAIAVRARPWRWVAAGATVVTVGAVAAIGLSSPEAVVPGGICESAPQSFGRDAQEDSPALTQTLTDSPTLASTWPALSEALDGYGHELNERWDRACALPSWQGNQVRRCLQRCGEGLVELRQLLATGQRETLVQGWSLIRALPEVDICVPDPASGDATPQGEWLAVISRARMLGTAGHTTQARAALEAMREELVTQDLSHAVRRIDIEMAEQLMIEGRWKDAREGLEACYFGAVAEGDNTAAARAAVRLVAQGSRTGNVDSALAWGRTSRTRLERMQPRNLDLFVVLEHNLAVTHLAAGDLTKALTRIAEAERWAREPGVSADLRAGAMQVHAELLLHAGRPAESLRLHGQLLEIRRQLPGHDLSTVVVESQSRANALATLHDEAGALAAYQDTHARAVAALGADHPQTASACIALARAQGDAGQTAQGQQVLAPCLRQLESSLGEGHPHVLVAHGIRARLARQAGQFDAAYEEFIAILVGFEQAFGESHYAVADILGELGRIHAARGENELARARFERALEVQRAAFPGQMHLEAAEALAQLATLDIADGDVDSAQQRLDQALAVFQQQRLHPDYIARWTAIRDGLERE
ncbi:MAG: serine/threonine-protein kinase [Deltaproteobacteria bacterium]|nr:serine/threonine-protein kinase [Deltaproteobacteria bacterium]